MRVIGLGDTHGRSTWKRILAAGEFDQVVFVGDYFDSADIHISARDEIENFEQILAYKKANPKRVVLLVGNHDFHYLPGVTETYSRFQRYFKTDIQNLLRKAVEQGLLQMSYLHEQYLFTHAGVTRSWFENTFGIEAPQDETIEKLLNETFIRYPLTFRFTPGENHSSSGDDVTQSPIWVRPNSLLRDAIVGFTQIVGHTQRREIVFHSPVVLIDTLGRSGQYLSILDGKLSAMEPPEGNDEWQLKIK